MIFMLIAKESVRKLRRVVRKIIEDLKTKLLFKSALDCELYFLKKTLDQSDHSLAMCL